MSEWPIEKLGEHIAHVESGTRPKGGVAKYTEGIPSLSAEHIQADGAFSFEALKYVPHEFYQNASRGKIRLYDILVVKDGATTGKSAIIEDRFPFKEAMVNEHTFILRTKSSFLPKLCFYALRSEFAFECFNGARQKGVIGSLNQDFVNGITIPVPPLDEQRRIVARIEELTRQAEEARKTGTEREAELDILLQAFYWQMIKGVEWKPLKEVASLVRRKIETEPNEEYEEMGIRSFGRGTFKKPVLTGKQIGNKRIYRIHEGDLVFNNVFAWEKAIAVAKPEDHGRVGSHRFISYVPHEGKATSEFLCHHFLSERGIEDIRAASPGSAGRNCTLGLKKLEKILVPVPEYREQTRFSEIAKRRQLIQLETAGIEDDIKTFTSALLAKAFRGEL